MKMHPKYGVCGFPTYGPCLAAGVEQAPTRSGWRIERWTLTESDAGKWVVFLPHVARLDAAIAEVRPGERIVNVATGRVVLEA
jgi:hypothetical protein